MGACLCCCGNLYAVFWKKNHSLKIHLLCPFFLSICSSLAEFSIYQEHLLQCLTSVILRRCSLSLNIFTKESTLIAIFVSYTIHTHFWNVTPQIFLFLLCWLAGWSKLCQEIKDEGPQWNTILFFLFFLVFGASLEAKCFAEVFYTHNVYQYIMQH